MPLYDMRCQAGHETEVLRPAGTAVTPCPVCGERATRVFRGRAATQHAPAADVANLARRFEEAMSEREASWQRAEANGEPVVRPNDRAAVQAYVDAKAYHGEYAPRRDAERLLLGRK